MKIRKCGLVVAFCVAFVFSGSDRASGATIFLTGHDPDYHASSGAGENPTGAQHLNQVAIEFILDPLFNPFVGMAPKFLFVEAVMAPVGGHKAGAVGLLNSGYVAGADYDLHGAGTLSAALDLLGEAAGYSGIVVASDFGGLLTQNELNILNSRSADIISFLNAGGGLYAMAESNGGAGLTPLGGHFGFLPFVVSSTAFDAAESGNIVTPFGASLGLVASDVNGNFSHNIFQGTFGLNAVDVDPQGNILSLAGRGVIVDDGVGQVTPVPEPGSLLLVASGIVAWGAKRRRRADAA